MRYSTIFWWQYGLLFGATIYCIKNVEPIHITYCVLLTFRCLQPPHLHLTTSKVMVIVWRLRGNIIWTVLYWQRATSSMGTVNKNSSHSPVGPWVCLCVFWVAWFIFMFMYVLFYLGQLSHFLSCFGAGITLNLNEPPSSFLLPPHYCGLGAGSIPFRAIVNKKQCEMRGLFMSLVIHYWIGDVQDCQGVSASEMTYIVSSGALNSTHSLRCLQLSSADTIRALISNFNKLVCSTYQSDIDGRFQAIKMNFSSFCADHAVE